jgi:hypothetical protein
MVITIGLSRRAAVRPVEERRFDLARGGGLCPTLPPPPAPPLCQDFFVAKRALRVGHARRNPSGA